jgi:hypothetical protein
VTPRASPPPPRRSEAVIPRILVLPFYSEWRGGRQNRPRRWESRSPSSRAPRLHRPPKRNRPTCDACAGRAMPPTPIGVLDALPLRRAPSVSASCAEYLRHPRVAALNVFPANGNSCERARPRDWAVETSQSIGAESEGDVRSHVNQVRRESARCFMLTPETRIASPTVEVRARDAGRRSFDDIGTRLPGRRQYKGSAGVVKRPRSR